MQLSRWQAGSTGGGIPRGPAHGAPTRCAPREHHQPGPRGLRRALLALAGAALVGAALAACGDSPAPPGRPDAAPPDAAPPDAGPPDASPLCANETRDDVYEPGLAKTGSAGFEVTLESSSPPPAPTGDYAWQVRVRSPASEPVDGLTLDVYPFMPDHGHGTSVQAVVTPLGGGGYAIEPLDLFHGGLWAIRVRLMDGSAVTLDEVVFRFCVAG